MVHHGRWATHRQCVSANSEQNYHWQATLTRKRRWQQLPQQRRRRWPHDLFSTRVHGCWLCHPPFQPFQPCLDRSRSALSLSVRSFRSLSGRSRSLSLSLSRSRSLEAESAAGASPRPVRGDDAAIARGADGGIIEVFNESVMDAEDEDCNNGDVWSVRWGGRSNCLSEEMFPLPSISAPSRSFLLRSDSRTDSRTPSFSPSRLLLSSR